MVDSAVECWHLARERKRSPMAKTRVMTRERKVDGVNAIPEEYANEGFVTRLNPEPVYYTPDGAGDLYCTVLERRVEELKPGAVTRDGKTERVYYDAVVLQSFKNGVTRETEEGEVQQPNAERGDMIRIGERHQTAVLARYAGKAIAVLIHQTGKVATKGGQTVWTFELYARHLRDEELELVKRSLVGGLSAPLIEGSGS